MGPDAFIRHARVFTRNLRESELGETVRADAKDVGLRMEASASAD
jgi:hypothetical protein